MTSTKDQHKEWKARNKKASWKILLLVTVVIIALLLVVITRKQSQLSSGSNTFTLRRDNLTVSVTAAGSIRTYQSLQYPCQVQNRGLSSGITILDVVPAGTQVTQEDVDNGMVLVQLDSSPLEDRLITEKMSLATADDNLTSAKESYDIQLIDNQSSIADGQLAVEFAFMDLQKYLGEELSESLVRLADEVTEDINDATANAALIYITQVMQEVKNDPDLLAGSSAGQQLKQLQDNIVIAQGNLTTREQTLAGTEKLYDANFVSSLQLQQDQLALENSRFSLESAQISLDLFLDYDFPKNAKQDLSSYIEAKRNLNRISAQCRSRLAQANSSLGSAQTKYDAQAEQVRQLEDQITNCTIKAKAPGMVVYGSGGSSDVYAYLMSSRGSGVIAKGETVTQGQVLISMPDTSAWIVEVSINETDVDKVRTGQSAAIVMDAFPDKTLHGIVSEVALLPDQQQNFLSPDRKVYKTLIRIDGSHDFLRSQMSCRVDILVERLEDVLVAPIIAIANNGGKKVCWILNSAGQQEERIVQTGVFNDSFVQIIEGLEAEQEIILNPPPITDLATATFDVFEEIGALPATNEYEIDQSRRGGSEVGDYEQTGMDMDSEQMGQMLEQFGGRRGGEQGSLDMDSEEIKQKMEQFMEQFGARGGGQQGDIDMDSEEIKQKMEQFMEQFSNRGGN
ncbi:efflux RND transporter periplasmic adaptor subunit [Planctomycetota bacterium]